jgi:hypothetical protein
MSAIVKKPVMSAIVANGKCAKASAFEISAKSA